MQDQARVVVIGGGVVGCSVLYHLARAGWTDSLLIERSELTSGSSWHAAGGFHTLNGDPNVAQLQAYTVSLYDELEALSGQSCGLHLTGGAMLADTPERMDFLRLAQARGRCMGMALELISPHEVAEMFPLMDPKHFVGALWDPVEGHLDPSGTTHAYAKAAQKLGASIQLRNPVVGLSQLADGTWLVETKQGQIKSEHVVNAGGLWAREVGRMAGLELPVLAMEHMYLLTEDMPDVLDYNQQTGRELIGVIDFKGEIYTRQERNGILLGTYEQACKPWSSLKTPWDFGHELLQPDLERIAPSLEIGFRHFPALENTGIKQVINGPFTFAPDGNPLVGPVPGLTNYWSACGVMAGFSQGGGVGLVLANWMTEGEPGFDVFGMDVARFGDWATLRYTNAKVRENYAMRFSIRYPNQELPAGRPQQITPLYQTMLDKGAVMGDSWGLETPLWFANHGQKAEDEHSFYRSNDFLNVAAESELVQKAVGVTEIANFAKYAIEGPGAEVFLSGLMTNKMPRIGRLVLTPMLNHDGKLIGDFTIAKATEQRFIMWGSSAAQMLHMRWFDKYKPKDGSVHIHRFDQGLVGLGLAGPRSREVLAKLVDEDISADKFRFMDYRYTAVAGVPCHLNRISYTGELGYEIWMAPTYEAKVYDALIEAGKAFGIGDFGMRALLGMRLEKNFPTWFAELRPIYGLFEADMGRFISFDKGEFIGRDAALADKSLYQTKGGVGLRRVGLAIEADQADVVSDEPVWAHLPPEALMELKLEGGLDAHLSHMVSQHDFGAARFNADGTSPPVPQTQVDGDWCVVGWVTSGGYGHRIRKSLAQAYVPRFLVEAAERAGQPSLQVEIMGKRCNADICLSPPYDPQGTLMRS